MSTALTPVQAVAAHYGLDVADVEAWPTSILDVFYRRLVRRGALVTAA